MKPLEAIASKCSLCGQHSPGRVEDCTKRHCALFPFRTGKMHPGKSPLKSIKGKCLDCAGDPTEVRHCDTEQCPIFPFRTGQHPDYQKPLGNHPRLITGGSCYAGQN